MVWMGMGLSQRDQWLRWSRQNIPINGKNQPRSGRRRGEAGWYFLAHFKH